MTVLKEIITTSPNFERIGIYFENIDEEVLDELFGVRDEKLNVSWSSEINLPCGGPQLDYEALADFPLGRDRTVVYRYSRVRDRQDHVLVTTRINENFVDFHRFKHSDLYALIVDCREGDTTPLATNPERLATLENKTIMELLIGHLGFIDIQRLRKVCSNIRTTIDHFKPIPNLTKLFVFFGCPGIINLKVDFENDSHLGIIYEEQQESVCRVNQSIVKQDLCITCIDDLKTCISRRDFSLDKFRLSINCDFDKHSEGVCMKKKWFLTQLENVLTPRSAPLKVRKFEFGTQCWEEILMYEPIKWLTNYARVHRTGNC
ncbi:hypothetical protein GCK72_020955 [Caenorhabditis remanei]|uniref:F-box domain-containing protein n=1 Tax=Caenorhabditis remanei TaxID=31234 RepID=A0A6A5GHY8_CAERE|nr:hypothetical protein GCK72_020955 [Caenorhabditis remanei]KAF1754394.1 hypothetical protein GCK72_020955 [Caenorhabditis remanei]